MGIEYQEDHKDGSKSEFHPDEEPGNFDNHYHIKTTINKMTDYQLHKLLTFLVDIHAIHKGFSVDITKGYTNKSNTSLFFGEEKKYISRLKEKEDEESFDIFSDVLPFHDEDEEVSNASILGK